MPTTTSSCPVGGFDHHSSEFRDDPYGAFDTMRSHCPISHSTKHGGFWSMVDYASVFEALRDDDIFNSYPSVGVPASPSPYPIIPIESDPPLTQKLRNVTVAAFSPSNAERLRPVAQRIVTDLINAFIERGECDIIAELTTPLPARLMLTMLGFDEQSYPRWVRWVHTFIHDRTHDEEAANAAAAELFGEIYKQMEARRAAGVTGNDLFDRILNGRIDDVPFDDTQIVMYTVLMMLGGMDTTSGLTGNALLQMMHRPELRQALIADPSLLKNATEEFLRHSTPTLGQARTVSRDAVFHGQHLRAGHRVVLMLAAANRDPKMFNDPATVNLHRANAKRHMAFGVGIHRCLGSHLARMMFTEMITQILERLPDFELNGTALRFEDAGEVYALRHLPIRFTPAQPTPVP